jgi:shikimate kinase
MELMLQSGCVVYLRAGIQRLLRQVERSAAARPLLNGATGIEASLEALLEQRKSFYERAHLSIELEKIHTDTFAQILEQCTSRQS